MILLNETFFLTPEDNQHNLKIPFSIHEEKSILKIWFDYAPKYVETNEALEAISRALPSFIPEAFQTEYGNPADYLPLENLITTSLTYETVYLGAHHKSAEEQVIQISAEKSSPGYLKQAVRSGNWELQMNLHAVVSNRIKLNVRIEVE